MGELTKLEIPQVVLENISNPLPAPPPETWEQKKERRKQERTQWLKDAGVENRHIYACFADYESSPGSKQAKVKDELYKLATGGMIYAEKAEAPRKNVILMCGYSGTGKTHLAVAIMREILRRVQSGKALWMAPSQVKYINLAKEYSRYLALQSVEERAEYLHRLMTTWFLVIDEVEKIKDTEGGRDFRARLLEHAYDSMLPRIIISNLSPASETGENELKAELGDWLYDRLRECAKYYAFDWDSYRGQK